MIEDTAELVTAAGGTGIAVPTDHLAPDRVQALADRIDAEQGRLDVLVNDIWGGEYLIDWHGTSLSSGGLAREYAVTDLDGSAPDSWRYLAEVQDTGKPADVTGYRQQAGNANPGHHPPSARCRSPQLR
ncbi:hypothetical protein DFQ14_11588 [Halopolyspora algeriensis]|uniref:Short subunit dehydrogenase n=1 Tax=Halopolyspora algeriensis TaxID=1500506 RepID=A0A368VF70_9ACTN|nr:hypothetical protein DFQ14_11588 [Halopolyspora algeriensis]